MARVRRRSALRADRGSDAARGHQREPHEAASLPSRPMSARGGRGLGRRAASPPTERGAARSPASAPRGRTVSRGVPSRPTRRAAQRSPARSSFPSTTRSRCSSAPSGPGPGRRPARTGRTSTPCRAARRGAPFIRPGAHHVQGGRPGWVQLPVGASATGTHPVRPPTTPWRWRSDLLDAPEEGLPPQNLLACRKLFARTCVAVPLDTFWAHCSWTVPAVDPVTTIPRILTNVSVDWIA